MIAASGASVRSNPAHDYVLWVLVAAAAAHALEERALGFVPWANSVGGRFGLQLDWTDFYLVNAAVVIWGICAAAVGWRLPGFSLSFPAMQTLNGLMHVAATVAFLRLSPGVFTGVFLYLPLSGWAFWSARRDGVLTRRRLLLVFLALAALFAVALLLNHWRLAHGFRAETAA